MPPTTRNQTTKSDAARVQSTQAKSGNDMSATGFSARVQSAGDRNANAAGDGSGKKSGGGQGSGSSGSEGGGSKAGGQGGEVGGK